MLLREPRQHAAALRQQYLRAPPIRRRVEPGQFDRAGKAQPRIHRRRDKFAVGIGGRDARHDLRVADHQVIAALGFERHPVAERRGERLRIGAGADDRPIGRLVAAVGRDCREPLSIEAKAECPRRHDLAALAPEQFDKRRHQPERIARMAVLAHEEAAHILARQARFELAQFVGVEFVDLDAVVAPQCPGEAVFRQRFGRAVDIKMPALMHESVGARHLRQFAHERHGRPDQGPHRARLRPDLLRRRRAHKSHEIGQDLWQIAPAQRQGPERVH